MARPLDPEASFVALKDGIVKTLKDEYFPNGEFKGKRQTLKLRDITVHDNLRFDDIPSQQKAVEQESTWAVPLKATFDLVDNASGKKLDSKTITIAQIPKVTPRFSYIVDGQERQVDHQSQLKDGIFTRVPEGGAHVESVVNTAAADKRRARFRITFDPQSHHYHMNYGTTNVPLLPILHAMGVPEVEIQKAWGKDIYEHNLTISGPAAVQRMHQAFHFKPTDDPKKVVEEVKAKISEHTLDPAVTKMVVNREHKNVTGDALLDASHSLLKITRGQEEPTGYDDFRFKRILHTEDYIPERLRVTARTLRPKVMQNIDRLDNIERIIPRDLFAKPIKNFFTTSQLAVLGDQTNPLGMITGHTKHTIMGEGGISSPHQVMLDAKIVHPSSIGFLDSFHTPESERTGINLQIPMTTWKEGPNLVTAALNAHTGKMEKVTATQLAASNLAFPDSFKIAPGQKPVALHPEVVVAGRTGSMTKVKPHEVDYILPSHASAFSVTTNLIPFLGSNSGNRVGYGCQQAHQALSLVHREAPMVQSATGAVGRNDTFESFVGSVHGHVARAAGTVTKIEPNRIVVKDEAGTSHEHFLYDNFPTNHKKGFLHSEPLVKVGDKVTAGHPLADTNHTKGGVLALGTNLTVGYLAADGMNFEDGVVISESAAKKLTSQHMHKHDFEVTPQSHMGAKKFKAHFPMAYERRNIGHIGEDGIAQVGAVVKPGDPLILAVRKNEVTSEAEGLSRISKGLVRDWKDVSVKWDGHSEGVVTRVIKNGDKIKVLVRTDEPFEVGDKLVGRHGNKGICTQIRPDHEMPHFTNPLTGQKEPIHVLLNPLGVPSRDNVGQIHETNMSWIAAKTGKPVKIRNFDPNVPDYADHVKEQLAAHGIPTVQPVFDPKTGKKMGEATVGFQYMLKLDQQVTKKMSMRGAGYGNPYDINKAPTTGGGRMGSLGNYALLAHGAVHNLREMQTYKSSTQDEVWRAVQNGDALPAPRVPYAYEKFEAMLKGVGVNIHKEGNHLILQPLTDAHVKDLSNGEVRDPGRMVRGKDLKSETEGLFDPKIFGRDAGGLKGTKWGHIKLDTAIPNPMFERAILTLTGLTGDQFHSVLSGKQELNGKTGPEAIGHALDSIDTDKRLSQLKRDILTAPDSKVDKMNREIRYLQNLKKLEMTPREAYMRQLVPVLPPVMRPLSVLPNGNLNTDDLNALYKGVGLVNHQLKHMDSDLKKVPEERGKLHAAIYDGMKALSGVGGLPDFHYAKKQGLHSIMGRLEGKDPEGKGQVKEGYFQDVLMSRKQDMSMRSTIIPNQRIKLDEIALPRAGALQMFKPHLVRELRAGGMTHLEAHEAIKTDDPRVQVALERVMKTTPVIVKRDPVLHKFGVQAFKARIASGNAIEIHPLACEGYNADFDGDVMSAFAPVSRDAIEEAHKMLPSNNLFNPTTGNIMYRPKNEALVGIYNLSVLGKKTNHKFSDTLAAAKAHEDGIIHHSDQITIAGKPTTYGRVMLDGVLPSAMRGRIAHSDTPLTGSKINDILTEAAKNHPKEYPDFVHAWKNLGNDAVSRTAFTISAEDVSANKALKAKYFAPFLAKESQIRNSSSLTQHEKDAKIAELYRSSIKEYEELHYADMAARKSNITPVMESGAVKKTKAVAVRQMNGAPIMFEDAKGKPIPFPVLHSYGEGLTMAEFMTSANGARMGTLSKSQGTAEPGALSKRIINSTMNQVITAHDCGTDKGILMDVNHTDVVDRFTASEIKLKPGVVIPAGTHITPELRDRLKGNGRDKVHVRSALKCAQHDGLCQKCSGLGDNGRVWGLGTNLGIISAHALGEPSTQMALSSFHSGGVVTSGSGMKTIRGGTYQNMKNLLRMPENLQGSAKLAPITGEVHEVQKDPAGGYRVHVMGEDKTKHNVWAPDLLDHVKKGALVKAGDPLSVGPVNPRELLPLAGLDAVKNSLTQQIHDSYGDSIRRRHVEVVARCMTNLAKVKDPGHHEDLLPGDLVNASYVQHLNSKVKSGQRPATFVPVLRGVEQLPLDMHEDWAARMNFTHLHDTVIEGSLRGWKSDIHGVHPVPGMMYGAEFGHGHDPTHPY